MKGKKKKNYCFCFVFFVFFCLSEEVKYLFHLSSFIKKSNNSFLKTQMKPRQIPKLNPVETPNEQSHFLDLKRREI